MNFIEYNGEYIQYIIAKKGTKNLYARIDENNVVKLSVPYFVPKKVIEKFVVESYFKLIKKSKKKKGIVNNGKIKILGYEKDLNDIDNLNHLLAITLKEYLKNNYLNIITRMGINNPPSVTLKRVKGYLGQYNKRNNKITLNILIGHLPIECIEYVIIHELTHIKYMNHQKEFWDEVEKNLPDYKKIRSKCKKEFIYYENY